MAEAFTIEVNEPLIGWNDFTQDVALSGMLATGGASS